MAQHVALILTQNGKIEEVTYTDADGITPLQDAVGGRIESVSYWTKNIDAYVNEEFLYTEGLTLNPFGANIGQRWLGNIVIPKITDHKRKRLTALGLLPRTCERHGGIWGDDETCAGCTDANGLPL